MEHILAKDLRNSIIQDAIQGKLTKQIENEYVDLSKLNLKKYKQTEELDFEIPSNWLVIHLEDISDGISTKPYQIKDSEVLKCGKYKVVSQSKELIIGFSNEKQKLFEHRKPVIVFGDHTTVIKYIDFDFVVGADGLKIFEPKYELLNPKYLEIVLNFYTISLDKVGGYSRHYKFIKDKPIPLPPIEEQQRIVDTVDELMTKIDEYEKIESQLVQLKEEFPGDMRDAILQAAMQGKITKQSQNDSSPLSILDKVLKTKNTLVDNKVLKKDQEYEDVDELFDIPENWLWTNLGKVCVYAFSGKSPEYVKVNNGNYTLGQAANQNDGIHFEVSKFCSDSHKEKCDDYQYLEENDTLLNTLGGGSVGRVGIYHNPNNYKCLTDGHIFVFRTKGIMNSKYLYYYMKMNQKTFEKMAEGSTNQSFLKLPVIKNYPIPVPPIEEQQRIVDLLDKVLPLCDQLKRNVG